MSGPYIYLGRDPVIRISTNKEGDLHCHLHMENWCKCIKKIYVNNLDAESLWVEISKLVHDGWIGVKVPVSVVANIWVDTRIWRIANEISVSVICPDTGEQQRLGILWPGEGRNVIRLMVYNWFIPKLIDLETGHEIALKCDSTSHNVTASIQAQRNLDNPNMCVAEQWSLYWKRRCLYCEEKLKEALSSDLVPQK